MILQEIENIFDEVFPQQINLKSFERKPELCPAIWRKGDMKPKIRQRLLEIANDFIDSIDMFALVPEDIVVVGSIAGYNWSKYSDIDLHIIVDMNEYSEYGKPDVLKALFNSKRSEWNEKHNITIFGYEVEIYIQDANEENASDGIYSIYYNKWNKLPTMKKGFLDKDLIKTQAAQYMNIIEKIEEFADRDLNEQQYRMLLKTAETINDEIMTGRRSGLANEGENAPGNIVFKVLRRTNHIGRLKKAKTKIYDLIYTL